MSTVIIVGGHSGDEEIMTGALAHRLVREGHTVRFVSLTNGDGGHPTLSRSEYAIQKERESAEAAAVIGAERVLYPASSGSLEISLEVQDFLAKEFRTYKPSLVITHWRGSIHRDHVAAYYNVKYAVMLAAKSEYGEGEPYKVPEVLYADNIEDPKDYTPNIIVETDESDERAWLESCSKYEFFRTAFYDFDYNRYYTGLHLMRGQMSGKKYNYGCALMRDAGYSYLATQELRTLELK